MKKRVVNVEAVTAAAADLADEVGFQQLTLALVAARLNIKPPSLYNHVDGLPALRRLLLLRGLKEFSTHACRAAVGKTGQDAIKAMAYAIREFARTRPGLYAATSHAHLANDSELMAAGKEALFPFEQVLLGSGLSDSSAIHALRTLRSAIHGFISLEDGGFGLPIDIQASFDWMVQTLGTAILKP